MGRPEFMELQNSKIPEFIQNSWMGGCAPPLSVPPDIGVIAWWGGGRCRAVGCDKYRIGYGSENDWNVVSCLGELRRQKERSAVITCNPQSVATGPPVAPPLP